MLRFRGIVSYCFLCFVLSCGGAFAKSDVGAVDYYRAKKGDGFQELVLKYAPTGQPSILPGEPFSINLSTAFMGKFWEFGSKGEIAIVARVSERGVGNGGMQWGEGAADSGRLIYFSNDVRENQHHNFSYIPMYGPMKYQGRPVDVQLYIFEIDDVEQFKPLLNTLTKAGQALYPPASPVLGMLDTLGSALLSAAKNDRMLEYTFSLWPQSPITKKTNSGYQNGEYPVLEAGHYIVTRQQDRKKVTDSADSNIRMKSGNHKLVRLLKDKDGVVQKSAVGDELAQPYVDDSYLVLHVKRESYSLTLDEENSFYQSFGAFKEVEAASNKEYADKINNELERLGAEFVRARQIKSVYSHFTGVSAAVKGQETEANLNGTKLLFELKEQIAKRDKCIAENNEKCGGAMTKVEIEEVLAMLSAVEAFKGQENALTYKALVGADIPSIMSSVVKQLPQSTTGN